jgi:hypothetical protein
MRELGAPIFLRDNLGLELALSNHSGAVHPADAHGAYLTRFDEIHPMRMAAGELEANGGEVAYYHTLSQQVQDWIAAHPWEFLRLCGRRLIEFILPPRWLWSPMGDVPTRQIGLRQLAVWAGALGGLATLFVMAPRQRPYAYILVAVLGCSLIYTVVQPCLRYRYMISTVLVFCAFDGAFRLIAHIRANVPGKS